MFIQVFKNLKSNVDNFIVQIILKQILKNVTVKSTFLCIFQMIKNLFLNLKKKTVQCLTLSQFAL